MARIGLSRWITLAAPRSALDELFRDKPVSFIKMDIEGAEFESNKCRPISPWSDIFESTVPLVSGLQQVVEGASFAAPHTVDGLIQNLLQ